MSSSFCTKLTVEPASQSLTLGELNAMSRAVSLPLERKHPTKERLKFDTKKGKDVETLGKYEAGNFFEE